MTPVGGRAPLSIPEAPPLLPCVQGDHAAVVKKQNYFLLLTFVYFHNKCIKGYRARRGENALALRIVAKLQRGGRHADALRLYDHNNLLFLKECLLVCQFRKVTLY
jgi:hypothetical protein